jgi:pimeloyl-ACP methyl ester carboxylesterase
MAMPIVTVDGAPVRYDRAGSGPSLVLLHGGGLDDARLSWAPLMPLVTRSADVIAPDLPGYGDSPLGRTPASITGYAAWLAAFLDALSVRECVLGGLSLGGAVALRTAIDSPQRVAALLGCAPYGVAERTPGGRLGWFAVHTPGLDALTWMTLRHSRRAVAASLRSLLRGPLPDDLVDAVQELARRPGAGAAWRQFQLHEVRWSGPRTVFGAELSTIRCPTVLLVGEHDVVPPAAVRAASNRVPLGSYAEIPGIAHWLPREAPDTVATHLLSLLTNRKEPTP